MPIPDFDHNQVLPPHLGDPRQADELSPFPVTSEEVCAKLATSPERRAILQGWLDFRQRLATFNIADGFQWLDGSFMEDIETSEARAPHDLDLITYFVLPPGLPPSQFISTVQVGLPEFFDRDRSRQTFHLDHFPVHLQVNGKALVDITRYWTGLFSHRRNGVWKGMLRVELNTAASDNNAAALLNKQP